MDTELENFIITFQKENIRFNKAAELHSFVEHFLQNPDEKFDLKTSMFLNIISKVPELFAALTNFDNANYNSESISDINEKETKNSNLQGALLCLEVLLLCYQHSKPPEQLTSLLDTTITVLHQSYTHCKDSEAIYGELLEDFADQLGDFLNKTQTVQTVMLLGLNTLLASELTDSETEVIVEASKNLGNLCNLVTSLDKTLAAKLWRVFIKIVLKHSDVPRVTLMMDSITQSLVSEIIEMVDDFKTKMETENLVEESEIKIFVYFTNLFMKLFHVFRSILHKSSKSIHILALKLSDALVLSYSPLLSADSSSSQLKSEIRSTAKSIVLLLYSDCLFVNNIFQLDNEEIPSRLQMAHVIVKSSVLNCTLSDKNTVKDDIFLKAMRVLATIENLQKDAQLVSIKIPNSLFNCSENIEETREELVTLYQYVCLRYSKYSKTVSDEDFEKIENIILKLIESSSELVSLLISDIWIYRLRCSSIVYVYSRIKNLVAIFSHRKPTIRYKCLLRRTIKFLPNTMLMELFKEHPCIKQILQENKFHHSYGLPHLTGHKICREDSTTVMHINMLMNELKEVFLERTQIIEKACSLLELFSLLVKHASNHDVIMFSGLAIYFFKSEVYDVQIAVLTFLKALKDKIFDEKDQEFRKVVDAVAVVLSTTLQSRNYMVKHEAFHNYVTLAQIPSLGRICRQTVVVSPHLAADIKSYFTKIPLNGFLTAKERMENLQELLSKSN